MQNKLASWKGKLLNKAGRLTLASSVLSSIPTYYMQINWLPQNICDNIDQTTHNFIWRGNNNIGVHLVNWKKVASPKQTWGLGIRAAREANSNLLGKLVWKLVQQTDKLWVNLLSSNYSSGPNFIFNASAHRDSSPTWSSIIRAKNVLKKVILGEYVQVLLPFGTTIGVNMAFLVLRSRILTFMIFTSLFMILSPMMATTLKLSTPSSLQT